MAKKLNTAGAAARFAKLADTVEKEQKAVERTEIIPIDSIVINKDNIFSSNDTEENIAELAKNIDNNDVKILTCLASNILKQFDKAVDLDGHLDNLKYTCDLDKKELLKALKKYNIDVNDINKAYNYLVRAQVNDVNNDAAHYHMIHVYMYKIILSDTPKEKERLIYKAKNEIAYCEAYYFENNPSIAFLYKTYKFYCANNYKNRAKLYWEEIHKLDRV